MYRATSIAMIATTGKYVSQTEVLLIGGVLHHRRRISQLKWTEMKLINVELQHKVSLQL